MAFIVRPIEPGDEAAVRAMTAAAFTREADEAARYEALWAAHPGAGPASVRVGVAGDEVVATLRVIGRDLRVGSLATLRTACICDVTTLKAHRGQGYGARLVRETLEQLRGEGYAVAYLDGIKDFYGRLFGFMPVMPFAALHLEQSALREAPAGKGRVRAATADDIGGLARLHGVAWGGRTGSLMRDPAHWRWMLEYHEYPIWLLEGAQGAITAYAHEYSSGNNLLDEWAARDAGAGLALLHWLAEEREWERGPLRLAGPPDYAAARALERRLPYEYEIYGHPDGGWMALILDPPAAIAALVPELGRRWLAERRIKTALRLLVDGVEIGLLLRRDGVRLDRPPRNAPVVELPVRHLAPLLFGARSVEELAGERGVRLPPAGRTILNILFPRAWAWLPGLDWF